MRKNSVVKMCPSLAAHNSSHGAWLQAKGVREAFVAARPYGASPPAVHPRWADLTPAQQRAWEAAAHAVLAWQQEKETPVC